MANVPETLTLRLTPETQRVINDLALRLNTTPEKVLAEGLVLLKKAQGKVVIFKEKNSNLQLEIDYTHPAPSLPQTPRQ